MKKILCLLLVFALLGALYACGGKEEPAGTEATDPTVSVALPETDPPTEQTDSPTEQPSEPEKEEPKYITVKSLLGTELYCESDPNRTGFLTFTDLAAGESIRGMSGNGFWNPYDTDELDWDNAVADAGELFAESKYAVRLENLENGWYAEFHDGPNAHYIYISSEELYVPIKQGTTAYEGAPSDISIPYRTDEMVIESINKSIAVLRRQIIVVDPLYRIDHTTVEEVAQNFVQRAAENYSLALGVEFTADDLRIESVSEDGREMVIYYELTGADYTLFADFIMNEDGTYTGKCRGTLVLDENGQWASTYALEYLSYDEPKPGWA